MLETYQRETKLFEFSRDTIREELDIGKSSVTLHWLHSNGFVAMAPLQRLSFEGFVAMGLLQWLRCNSFYLPRLPCL